MTKKHKHAEGHSLSNLDITTAEFLIGMLFGVVWIVVYVGTIVLLGRLIFG